MSADYSFTTSGRNRRTVTVLALYWAFLVALLFSLQASRWVVAGLWLFSLPALWDLISDRVSGVEIGQGRLAWRSGARHGEVTLADIRAARFDTRLDFTVRVTLIMRDGRKLRLPYDALPPHRNLEHALQEAGVATERRHFALL